MQEPGKILVVDDTAQTRLLVGGFLSEQGYDVIPAASGPEALDILRNDPSIDLVLLDIIMPGMNGLDTLKEIKKNEAYDLIRVLVLTSSKDTEDLSVAFEAGAVDYINKPYYPPELKARVDTHIKLKHRVERLKQQEVLLRQSEERLKTISQMATDFAFLLETDQGEILKWIWTFGNIQKYIKSDFEQIHLSDIMPLLHADDLIIFKDFASKLAKGNSQTKDFRVKDLEGHINWVRVEIKPMHKSVHDYPHRYMGVVKNITELKKTEEDLEVSNRYMQKVFHTAPMRMMVYNLETKQFEYLDVLKKKDYNQKFEQQTEWGLSETRWINYSHFVIKDRSPAKKRKTRKNIKNELEMVEYPSSNPDGINHWYRTYITPFEWHEDNQVTKVLAINLDITEEKEAKQALQKARDDLEENVRVRTLELEKTNLYLQREIDHHRNTNAYLQAMLNNHLQAFILLDPEKKVLTYNAVYENISQRYFHKKPGDEMADSLFFLEPDKGVFEIYFNKALQGVGDEFEINLPGQGGIPRSYRVNFSPSFTQDKKVMGVCVAMLDVTRQKRIEKELVKERLNLRQRINENTAKLQESNTDLLKVIHAKDEFLNMLSHEFRYPVLTLLSIIQSFIDSSDQNINDQQRQIINKIKERSQYILNLVNGFVDTTRIEPGRYKLEMTEVFLEKIIHDSINLVQGYADQKVLKINVNIKAGLASVRADEYRLRQMMVNLLYQAIESSCQGSTIGISVERKADKNEVAICVWDQGSPIPVGLLPHIFSPFEVMDEEMRKAFPVNRLALYLTEKIAEMHGGRLVIESQPETGNKYTIFIPWFEIIHESWQNQWRSGKEIIESGRFQNCPVVMLTGDNEISMSVISNALKESGCQVIEVRNEKELIEQMDSQITDIVLMDLEMREMDGFKTIHLLRENGFTRTPVIAFTSQAFQDLQSQIKYTGINDILSKPVDLGGLIQSMSRLLN